MNDDIETIRSVIWSEWEGTNGLIGEGKEANAALDRLEAELSRKPMKVYFPVEDAEKLIAENERLRENYDAAVDEAEAQAAEVERLRAHYHDPTTGLATHDHAEVDRLRARANGTCSKHDDHCHDQAIANFEAWQGALREVERLRATLKEIDQQGIVGTDDEWAGNIARTALAEEKVP